MHRPHASARTQPIELLHERVEPARDRLFRDLGDPAVHDQARLDPARPDVDGEERLTWQASPCSARPGGRGRAPSPARAQGRRAGPARPRAAGRATATEASARAARRRRRRAPRRRRRSRRSSRRPRGCAPPPRRPRAASRRREATAQTGKSGSSAATGPCASPVAVNGSAATRQVSSSFSAISRAVANSIPRPIMNIRPTEANGSAIARACASSVGSAARADRRSRGSRPRSRAPRPAAWAAKSASAATWFE